MAGLFSIFSVGVRGMTTQQTALNVTSHNIANANTEGYTRQKVLIQATRPFDGEGITSTISAGQLGTGSEVTMIQRVRDSFLDFQVRDYTTTQGQYNASEKYLSEIEGVFNEPSEKGISNLMGKFFSDWQNLAMNPGNESSRNTVVTDSSTLADELNHTFNQLQNIKTNINASLNATIVETNSMLNQIDVLNKQIINVKIGENEPNDLMDKRDKLLDTLSTKLGVVVDKKDFYGTDISTVVQKDINNPSVVNDAFNNPPTNAALVLSVKPTEVRRFSYISGITKSMDTATPPAVIANTYDITYYKNGDMTNSANASTIRVNLSTSLPLNTNTAGYPTTADVVAQRLQQISENRVLWGDNTGTAIKGDGTVLNGLPATTTYNFNDIKMLVPVSGEIAGFASVQVDVDKYIDKINNMAKGLAFAVNAIHSGVTDVSTASTNPAPTKFPQTDYLPFFVNSDVANLNYVNNNIIPGTSLDAVLAAESSITAGNISVNKSIINDSMKVKTRTHDDQFAYESNNNIDGIGDGARAKMIAGLQNNLVLFQAIGNGQTPINSRKDMFTAGIGGNSINGLTFNNNPQGTTLDNYFKDIIHSIASQEQTATRMISNQQALLDTFSQNRESISGVSLDEEMANMVQFQHAYQANAKIISTIDQLLDVVIALKK